MRVCGLLGWLTYMRGGGVIARVTKMGECTKI